MLCEQFQKIVETEENLKFLHIFTPLPFGFLLCQKKVIV